MFLKCYRGLLTLCVTIWMCSQNLTSLGPRELLLCFPAHLVNFFHFCVVLLVSRLIPVGSKKGERMEEALPLRPSFLDNSTHHLSRLTTHSLCSQSLPLNWERLEMVGRSPGSLLIDFPLVLLPTCLLVFLAIMFIVEI